MAKRHDQRAWTEFERGYLRAVYADTFDADLAKRFDRSVSAIKGMAQKLGLRKSAAHRQLINERTQFGPGHQPPNKGRKGYCPPGCEKGWFQKGSKPHTWMPVGSLRITPYRQLERKVNDLPGPNHVRWKPVSRLVWEAAHGPVPPGYVVRFKAGMHTTVEAEITLDRLVLLSQAENMRLNTIHRYPPELKQAIRLVAKVRRTLDESV